jgi:hypothetical protein
MRFLAERTQFRRDRVVVPIARKHLLPDPLFSAVFSAGGLVGVNGRQASTRDGTGDAYGAKQPVHFAVDAITG